VEMKKGGSSSSVNMVAKGGGRRGDYPSGGRGGSGRGGSGRCPKGGRGGGSGPRFQSGVFARCVALRVTRLIDASKGSTAPLSGPHKNLWLQQPPMVCTQTGIWIPGLLTTSLESSRS
jgi:hypothetical protein